MAATTGPKKTSKSANTAAKKPSAKKRGGKKTYPQLTVLTLVLDLNEVNITTRDRITDKINRFVHDEDIASVLVAIARNPPPN